MPNLNRQELVLELRRRWQEEVAKGRTLGDLQKELLENGFDMKPTTLRRVLVDGDINQKFGYEDILYPLFYVLIDKTKKTDFDPEYARKYYDDMLIFRKIITEKNFEIEELELEIAALKKEIADLKELMTSKSSESASFILFLQNSITFLQGQLELCRSSNKELLEMMREMNRAFRLTNKSANE